MSETILTAENLKFRYDPEQPVYALDGVSASVKRGEFVAVLGANGCGKSTLAKQFNAILLPEAGTVLVEGMDTADESKIYDIRQTVGMVFQNPDNQIVATVVEEDVAFALENLGVPPEEMRRRVDDAMKMAGHLRVPGAGTPPPFRRPETARCHCRRRGHAAGLPHSGRSHRHAGPPGPGAGDADHPLPQQEHGHHRGVHHPLYGRSCHRPTGCW